MEQQRVTDAELMNALTRRLHKIRQPQPSQPFTVHDDIHIFQFHPSELHAKYGGGGADASGGCIYFFSDKFTYQDGWKVAAGTQPVMNGGGAVIGSKDTLVFHEGRWLPKTQWAMDELETRYQDGFDYYLYRSLHLYSPD